MQKFGYNRDYNSRWTSIYPATSKIKAIEASFKSWEHRQLNMHEPHRYV
jgi:hypothetical protein